MAIRAHATRVFNDRKTARRAYRRSGALTIRWATPEDEWRVETLAELDEATVPAPPLLLGLVGEELWVAASLLTGAVVSDPFRASAEVAALVLERGSQLTVPGPHSPGRRASMTGRRRSPRLPLLYNLGDR